MTVTVEACDRREVELKFRVHDPAQVATALAANGVELGGAFTQDDQAYAPASWSYGQSKLGVTFARLRTQHDRHVFTLKTPVTNELDCTEYECEVSDRQQMHLALLAMGFRPTVRIVKRRRIGRVGSMNVCVDEVSGLGAFLEVEMVTGDSVANATSQMDAFVRSLGLAGEPVTQTYDSLLRAAAASTE